MTSRQSPQTLLLRSIRDLAIAEDRLDMIRQWQPRIGEDPTAQRQAAEDRVYRLRARVEIRRRAAG